MPARIPPGQGSVQRDGRVVVEQVETHVCHTCNLFCESCSHFSQEGHTGRHSPESFTREVVPWGRRIVPKYLLLLGGEPTLNPDLAAIIPLTRKAFPDTFLILVSNGWFLHRHPDLAAVLKSSQCRLDLSIHHDDPAYLAKLAQAEDWAKTNGVPYRFRNSFRRWTRIYRGEHGADVRPYTDGNAYQSWSECVSKFCMQIHEGKLWKCPPLAYLPMQARKFGFDQPGSEAHAAWAPYLAYKALPVTSTQQELVAFTSRTAEDFCKMCPAHPEHLDKGDPTKRHPLSVVES
jgi:hypothetical protein